MKMAIFYMAVMMLTGVGGAVSAGVSSLSIQMEVRGNVDQNYMPSLLSGLLDDLCPRSRSLRTQIRGQASGQPDWHPLRFRGSISQEAR